MYAPAQGRLLTRRNPVTRDNQDQLMPRVAQCPRRIQPICPFEAGAWIFNKKISVGISFVKMYYRCTMLCARTPSKFLLRNYAMFSVYYEPRKSAKWIWLLLSAYVFSHYEENDLIDRWFDIWLTGDFRVNEQVGLASMHNMFVTFHNFIERNLARVNRGWNGERLFQVSNAGYYCVRTIKV